MLRLSFAARTAPRFARFAALPLVFAAPFASGCSSVLDDAPLGTETGGTDEPVLGPGEYCEPPSQPNTVRVRFEPSFIVVAPCADASGAPCSKRSVNVVVDPDFCEATPVRFTSSDPSLFPPPPEGSVTLHQAVVPLKISGATSPGTFTLTAAVARGDGTEATATLEVDVVDATPIACSGPGAKGLLGAGTTLAAGEGATGATITLPAGADQPNQGSFLWSVEPFDAEVRCGGDITPPGHVALGPAITFGPEAKTFRRELPMSIPLNPALLPDAARWRHLRIAYSGPAFKAPRTVPVADPRIEKVNGTWAVTFKAPRLGTYQAVVASDAGTRTRFRRLTHRAVIGVSMGGGGAAMFGMRHHDLFDVIAPLGGPVDWTWLLHHIEQNHLGGFRPIAPGTKLEDIPLQSTPCQTKAECLADEQCVGALPNEPGRCIPMPEPEYPYEHSQAFNAWWAEFPRTGTGGRFPRGEYAQIFRDLALMFGNPNGDNLTPGAENLPAGVRPDDPSQTGDHPNGECTVWVDPIGGHPDEDKQKAIAESCPIERCKNTLTLTGYFDDEYNPDGTFPVITICDGSPQKEERTPYANWWTPEQNDYPLEVALAVDYNGNGVRDELEPVIRAGHERWSDVGEDGVPSEAEPGYAPGTNEDPAGDDYHPQYNPTGTEKDRRWQPGEPFDDFGLDGVAGTKQQPPNGWQQPGDGYDVGEGDGKFTVSRGLRRFWDFDARSVVRGTTPLLPGGPLDDDALFRIDLWTDGGTRDLFNFAVDAQHLVGAFAARGRDVAYLTDFTYPMGLDPAQPDVFEPERIVYEDLQGVVMQRYGKMVPTPEDIENGSGQHVGTVFEIASRLQTALYFIGSRWPEPELRQLVAASNDAAAPGAPDCEILGNCTIEFTSSDGRTGPVGITLPPGYAHEAQQTRRYPVIYMLHGYGQTPEDLEAAIVFLRNWMNSPTKSGESRLPKAILVYVDGRCRTREGGKAECIRGSFFTDSVRKDGFQAETWWLELMDYIDQNFRTMGESVVEWTE